MTPDRPVVRPPEHLVFGDGVYVSGRVGAYLLRYADLDRFRREHRGEDAEVDTTLMAITLAALRWRETATGTSSAPKPELDRDSQWLGTQAAATHLGVTTSAIRKAIRARRLHAEKIGNGYRISREALAHYQPRR